MFEWIKKHIIIFSIFLIFILIGVPFIINLLFKFNIGIELLCAEWSAGDLLVYYGSVLSFLGTVVLGALALYQNKIIKEQSDQRNMLLEQKELKKNMPKFSFANNGFSGRYANLSITIKNISDNNANDLVLYNIVILNKDNETVWKSKKNYRIDLIAPHEEKNIELTNDSIKDNSVFQMNLDCKDKYDNLHQYIIIGKEQKRDRYLVFEINELNC